MMERERVQEVLDQLDPALIEELSVPKKRCRAPLWRTGLIAACVCFALAGTALAGSPGLRERLSRWLGGFAPYVQDVEEVSCTQAGIEVKVVSAMADTAMVKVYAEARDLEGDRLSADMSVHGRVKREIATDGLVGSVFGAKCISYDESTKTALLEITTWGMGSELTGAELIIMDMGDVYADMGVGDVHGDWKLPLTIEQVETRSFKMCKQVGSVKLRGLSLSPLGLALETEGEAYLSSDVALSFENGDTLRMEKSFMGGGVSETGRTVHWDFDDPIDIDTVVGVSVGGCYIPLSQDE